MVAMQRQQLRRLWRPLCSTDAVIAGRKCLDCRCISIICLAVLKTEYDDELLSAAQRFFLFRYEIVLPTGSVCIDFRAEEAINMTYHCTTPIRIQEPKSKPPKWVFFCLHCFLVQNRSSKLKPPFHSGKFLKQENDYENKTPGKS